MTALLQIPDELLLASQVHFVRDDFNNYTTGGLWSTITGSTTHAGTAVVSDGANGILTLTNGSAAAAADEIYVGTTAQTFLPAAGKPMVAEASLQFTEAATNKANVIFGIFGVSGNFATGTLQAAGAGPASTFVGAVFSKVSNKTNWQVTVSNGATQQTVDLSALNSLTKAIVSTGGANYQKLRVEIRPLQAGITTCDVAFFVDDVLVYKFTGIDMTGTQCAGIVFGIKNGTTSIETLNVDYCQAAQVR